MQHIHLCMKLPVAVSIGMMYESVFRFSYFFFQAEDGIRDLYVTGVQRVLFRSERGPANGGAGSLGEWKAGSNDAGMQSSRRFRDRCGAKNRHDSERNRKRVGTVDRDERQRLRCDGRAWTYPGRRKVFLAASWRTDALGLRMGAGWRPAARNRKS